jgi:hypothetical protein
MQRHLAGGASVAAAACALLLVLAVIAQSPAIATNGEATPTAEPGLFRAYRALSTPAIDGNLSDWPLLGGILLSMDTAYSFSGSFSGHADGSTTCWSQWNDAMLFVACDTLDDLLFADSTNIWQDDTVELAFDGRNDNIRFCGAVYCPDDHNYELRVDGAVRDNDLPVHQGVVGTVVQRQGGYRLEVAIPWTEFDAGPFVSGKVMGFNLGLIDDDNGGGPEGHLFWRGYSTYSQPEGFGDIVLDPRSGTPIVTPSATATPTETPTRIPSPSPTPTATAIALVDIDNAEPIACGQSTIGTTQGAANHVQTYSCVPWWPETGPEKVYRLDLAEPSRVDAVLAGATADLDLFLLTGASPSSCVAHGDTGLTAASIGPGAVYLVIDGFGGASGGFRLTVWCPLDPTPGATATPTATPGMGSERLYFPLLRAD